MDITMPEATIGRIEHPVQIAAGPFVVIHNGDTLLGGYMNRSGDDEVVFGADGRSFVIDDSYTIESNDDMTIATSIKYQSSFMFRAIQADDAEWISPGVDYDPDVEELIEIARDDISGM